MHQKLRADHFLVDRETVRILLKVLDADGAELQSSHCLARRTYISAGPNYLRHIDGYDKIWIMDMDHMDQMELQFMTP